MVVLLVVLFSDDDALLFVVVTFEFELFWAYDDLIIEEEDGNPISYKSIVQQVKDKSKGCQMWSQIAVR